MARDTEFLLDASALLAVMRAEPGAGEVLRIIDRAAIHSVQIAEVVRKLRELGVDPDEVEGSIQELCLPVIEVLSVRQACNTGRYCLGGLSLGDRICLAMASSHGSTAVTADRRWKEVCDANAELNVRVMLIR